MTECPVCKGTGISAQYNTGVCGYCRGTGIWDYHPYIAATPGAVLVDGVEMLPADIAERFGHLAQRLEEK